MRKRWPFTAAAIGVAIAITVVWLIGRDGGGAKSAHSSRAINKQGGAPASLAGTVSAKAGAAIDGAWVCATSTDDDVGDDMAEPRCATTNADGGWRLGGLFAGPWSVTAGADRKVPVERAVYLRSGESRDGLDLELADRGVLVAGTVLDLTGGPVAGARVSIRGAAGATCLTRSGDAGAFRCWIAPGLSQAFASADGYTQGSTFVNAPEDAIELLLTPESTLDGTVVLAGTEEPVVGALVVARGEGDRASAISDEAGHFHLRHLPPGRYKLTASALALHGEAEESVMVGLAQGKHDLVIEMHPAATVDGTVTLDGEPVDDCTVSLRGAAEVRYRERTADDGTVTFDAVQPCRYRVWLECSEEVGRPPYADVIVADQPVEVTWEVDTGSALTGTVVDDTGAPVAGASVKARRREATTDADGRFTLDGLEPGRTRLVVRSEEHVSPDPPVEVQIGADHDVRIVLTTGGVVTGTVVNASGTPVASVDVMATGPHVGDLKLAKTRDDGTFSLRGVRPGDHRVVAMREYLPLRRPGATDDDTNGEPVTVAAGESASVRIVVEDASGSIRGRVVDAAGAPVGDAFLRAERESDAAGAQQGGALESAHWSWDRKPSITGIDGTFTIDGLGPGNYTVLAFRKGGSEASQEGVAVGESVTLTIARAGSLSGTVTSASGPPRTVMIGVFDKQTGFERLETFFSADGRWAIRDLPAGHYDVVATTSDGKAKLESIALGEGEDRAGLELALATKVNVTGRLIDAATHAPIKGVRVSISPVGEPFSIVMADSARAAHPTEDDGRFEVLDVPIGKGGLLAVSRKYSTTKRSVDVQGTGTVDLGDVALHASRLPPNTQPGDLGFTLVHHSPYADPASVEITIASIAKDGPAAASGLQVGDVIVSIDGNDVRGDNAADYYGLTSVPAGTEVTFTLASGATARITASKAR